MIINLDMDFKNLSKLKYKNIVDKNWSFVKSKLKIINDNKYKIDNTKIKIVNLKVDTNSDLNVQLSKKIELGINLESNSSILVEDALWRRNILKDLISYMPIYYKKSKIIKMIMVIYAAKLREEYSKNEEMKEQFIIKNSSFCLPYYEYEYGKKSYCKDEKRRRIFIEANRYALGKVMNLKELKLLLNKFYDCDIDEDIENSMINIKIKNKNIDIDGIKDLNLIARTFIPAHIKLAINYDLFDWKLMNGKKFKDIKTYSWKELELLNK